MEPSEKKKEGTDALIQRSLDYRKNLAVKSKLIEGFKPIALSEDVWTISSRQKTFTEHTELHHELGRDLDMMLVIKQDYFKILEEVEKFLIQHVLVVAETNPRLAKTNFYTLFKDFKVPNLQKVLTKTSVVPIEGENEEVAHTEDFIGGWNIVRMKSALSSTDGFNYWLNTFPKRVHNEPVQLQPYGPLQCIQLLDICDKIVALTGKMTSESAGSRSRTRIVIMCNHLSNKMDAARSQGQEDTAKEIEEVLDKVEVFHEMNTFPVLVGNYCLNTVRTVMTIVENSINQMEDKVLASVAKKEE